MECLFFLSPMRTWICRELVYRSYTMQTLCLLSATKRVVFVDKKGFLVAVVDQVNNHTIGWRKTWPDIESVHPPYKSRKFANLLVLEFVTELCKWPAVSLRDWSIATLSTYYLVTKLSNSLSREVCLRSKFIYLKSLALRHQCLIIFHASLPIG